MEENRQIRDDYSDCSINCVLVAKAHGCDDRQTTEPQQMPSPRTLNPHIFAPVRPARAGASNSTMLVLVLVLVLKVPRKVLEGPTKVLEGS